jgi:hypothetical protein
VSTPARNALDGLVATVDDLVRDLAGPQRTELSVGTAAGRGGATLRGKALTLLVVLVVLALELVVVSWLVSNM